MKNDQSQIDSSSALVDLWCVSNPEIVESGQAFFYETLLSADERTRWQRFARPEDRARFLTTRALLRTVLAEYQQVAPEALEFHQDAFGKPHVVTLSQRPAVHFNLSHTQGMAVLAVCREAEVGVDVEDERRTVRAEELTRRYFAEEELQTLQSLPEAERRAHFIRLWTLKEAYVKALGMGLRVPLDGFAFDLTEAAVSFIRREGKGAEQPLALESLQVASHFRVGLAVATNQAVALHIHHGAPLKGFARID